MHGRGGGCMAGGHAWQGACMVGGIYFREGMCGRGGMRGIRSMSGR